MDLIKTVTSMINYISNDVSLFSQRYGEGVRTTLMSCKSMLTPLTNTTFNCV